MMFYCFILRKSDITYEELTLFVQVLFWNPMLDESDITYEELTHAKVNLGAEPSLTLNGRTLPMRN